MKSLILSFIMLLSGATAFADYGSHVDYSVPYVGCDDAALSRALDNFERGLPSAVGICQSSRKTVDISNFTIDLLNSNCPASAQLETYIKSLIKTSSDAMMIVILNCSPGGK